MAEISARFVNLPADQVDGEIEAALHRVCEILGVDRSTLWQLSKVEPRSMLLTHFYQPPDAPPIAEHLDGKDTFPWTMHQVLNGEVVAFAAMSGLPPEAAQDYETWCSYGTKSTAVFPLTVGDAVCGVVSFATIRKEREWPDALMQRLQLVAQILANAIARKQADQDLRESESRLSLATNAAGAGLWVMDLDAGTVWASEKTRELFHFAADEKLTYESFHKVTLPEDRERVHQAVQQTLQSGERFQVDYRIIQPDGRIRWIVARGRRQPRLAGEPIHIMGVSIDITERKQMEEELGKRLREIESLRRDLQMENIVLREEVMLLAPHEEIVGRSAAMQHILVAVEQVAPMDSTVLLTGETGTGKELIAQAIHNLSKRKGRLLVKVNCASLPAALVESELFGREKGAYTGALAKQLGRFELANHSTLFLDEIGDMPLELQAKLLRVLETGEFERLGSPKTIRVDVRVVAATNRDIAAEVRKGTFRQDLYYRLNVFPMEIPPLRARTEDIPLLVDFFVREFSKKMGKNIETVPRKAMDALLRYPWPGNIRELRNVIEHAVIVSPGNRLNLQMPQLSGADMAIAVTLEEADRQHIKHTLQSTKGRIKGAGGAADLLGMKPSTLYAKMKKLGIFTRTQRDAAPAQELTEDVKTK